MSKQGESADKKIKATGHKEAPATPVAHHSGGGHGGGAGKKKAHEPVSGGCFVKGCRVHADKLNFCAEHYDHFKFGLIKKSGEQVPDFEKKIGHYLAFKSRKSAQKVA
jgi:hypothetical protein